MLVKRDSAPVLRLNSNFTRDRSIGWSVLPIPIFPDVLASLRVICLDRADFRDRSAGRNRLRSPLDASAILLSLERDGGVDIVPSSASIGSRSRSNAPFENGKHTMKRAMQRLDQVRKVLGPNDRWILIQASDSPSIQRWIWDCGCLIECTGNGRNHEAVI